LSKVFDIVSKCHQCSFEKGEDWEGLDLHRLHVWDRCAVCLMVSWLLSVSNYGSFHLSSFMFVVVYFIS
jgi:hypothetical protein